MDGEQILILQFDISKSIKALVEASDVAADLVICFYTKLISVFLDKIAKIGVM